MSTQPPKSTMSPKSVNFARTADDYREFRAGFPDELFERLEPLGLGQPDQRVVDIGTGTGSLGRGFASRGCRVIGVDPAEELLAEAHRLDEHAGLSTEYQVGRAERTELPTDSCDVVGVGQAWHWFERHKAIREVHRILVPGGRLLLAHFDWLPLPGTVVDATEKLIRKYNPRWALSGSTGVYPHWLTDVRVAGFEDVQTFSFDMMVPYEHKAWRGRVRASSGVAASMPVGKVSRFDETLRTLLVERFPDEPLQIPHCVWALVCRAPGG